MKSLSNWLIVIFMVMYWIFRIIVSYTYAMGIEFVSQPLNQNTEIILLFSTLLCIVLVVKRKMLGGIIYIITYGGYFGVDLYNILLPVLKGQNTILNGMELVTSIIAIILAIAVAMDLCVDRIKKPNYKNSEWFYNNKNLNVKKDERDDKNNYKIIDK